VRIEDSFGDMRVILHGISQDNDLRDPELQGKSSALKEGTTAAIRHSHG